jgi:hypothetical protein
MWPIVDVAAPAKGLILPKDERRYTSHPMMLDWRAFLIEQSPLDTTAGLSMPFWGLISARTRSATSMPDPVQQ